MIAAQHGGRLGIKVRVFDDQFLVLITPSVVPNDGPTITEESAAGGIAPATGAEKVNAWAMQIQVGVVIHTIAAGCPERQGIITIGTDVTVDNDGTGGTAVDGHLVSGIARLHHGAIVVVDCQATDDAVVGPFLQYDDAIAYRLAVILSDLPRLRRLSQDQDRTVAVFAHQYDVRAVDDHLLVIRSLADQNLIWLRSVLWCLLYHQLDAVAHIHHGIKVGRISHGLAEPVNRAILVGALRLKTDAHLVGRIILISPGLIQGIEGGRTGDIPAVAIATLASDLLQTATGNAVTVTNEWLVQFQVVEARPHRLSLRIGLQPRILVSLQFLSHALHLIARQLILVEPRHRCVDGLLHPLVGIRQFHQQTRDGRTLLGTIGRQFKRTGRGRQHRLAVVLLTPDRQFAIGDDLRGQDARDTLVEGGHHPLSLGLVRQVPLIRLLLLTNVAEQGQRVHHRVIVVGDVNLVVAHLGPELRPAAVLILSAEQIVHRLAETLAIALVLGLLIQASQEDHLDGRGVIVRGRVVAALLVGQHLLTLLACQFTRHIYVLWPAAGDPLIQQELVTDPTGLGGLKELRIGIPHHTLERVLG